MSRYCITIFRMSRSARRFDPEMKTAAKAKRPYHHGNLRRALLDAARTIVKAHGMDALTLREVARQVGVTHAAPYHHFSSREELLDALAEEGFALLDATMREALARSDDVGERLAAIGRAYIDFARAHPERLQVMFRRRAESSGQSEVVAPQQPRDDAPARVFGHLFDAVRAGQEAGFAPSGDPYALALTAWSLVHGFSKLWIEGPLALMPPYGPRYETLRDDLLARFGASLRELARAERRTKRA
jgi:AcrR family transcriptional regulator